MIYVLKKHKSKRFLAIAVASALVVAAGLGGTYAWFTSRIGIAASGSMGLLHITTASDFQMAFDYEPGNNTRTVDVQYKNDGSITAFFKVDLGRTSIGKAVVDDEGYWAGWLPEDQWQVNPNDPNITITPTDGTEEMNSPDLGFYMDDNGYGWIFAKGVGAHEGEIYVFVDPGYEIQMFYELGFSPAMGNNYQGATIDLSSKNEACQANWDAIAASYNGLGDDDLAFVWAEHGSQSASISIASYAGANQQKAMAMLNRMLNN